MVCVRSLNIPQSHTYTPHTTLVHTHTLTHNGTKRTGATFICFLRPPPFDLIIRLPCAGGPAREVGLLGRGFSSSATALGGGCGLLLFLLLDLRGTTLGSTTHRRLGNFSFGSSLSSSSRATSLGQGRGRGRGLLLLLNARLAEPVAFRHLAHLGLKASEVVGVVAPIAEQGVALVCAPADLAHHVVLHLGILLFTSLGRLGHRTGSFGHHHLRHNGGSLLLGNGIYRGSSVLDLIFRDADDLDRRFSGDGRGCRFLGERHRGLSSDRREGGSGRIGGRGSDRNVEGEEDRGSGIVRSNGGLGFCNGGGRHGGGDFGVGGSDGSLCFRDSVNSLGSGSRGVSFCSLHRSCGFGGGGSSRCGDSLRARNSIG
mmetsp:Transcript_9621/g.23749  ORF Transcript_9621/g.23749 Transcript_9621/m.23749 type:complete len:371 (+) Transcript_9621:239-1351(+)